LVDFGVSLLMQGDNDAMTSTMGTKLYFAPELFAEEEMKGKKTDIWSCGVTLYYMLYKKLPFNGFDHDSLMKKICHEE
jgi:serine/threonine protein kinase